MTVVDRANKRFRKASPEQVRYLEILLNDCNFGTRLQRNAWLSSECKRPISFIDELTKAETAQLITDLKERRDQDFVGKFKGYDDE